MAISPEDLQMAKDNVCDLLDQMAEAGRMEYVARRGAYYDRSDPTSRSPELVPTGEVVVVIHNCTDIHRAQQVLNDA